MQFTPTEECDKTSDVFGTPEHQEILMGFPWDRTGKEDSGIGWDLEF